MLQLGELRVGDVIKARREKEKLKEINMKQKVNEINKIKENKKIKSDLMKRFSQYSLVLNDSKEVRKTIKWFTEDNWGGGITFFDCCSELDFDQECFRDKVKDFMRRRDTIRKQLVKSGVLKPTMICPHCKSKFKTDFNDGRVIILEKKCTSCGKNKDLLIKTKCSNCGIEFEGNAFIYFKIFMPDNLKKKFFPEIHNLGFDAIDAHSDSNRSILATILGNAFMVFLDGFSIGMEKKEEIK